MDNYFKASKNNSSHFSCDLSIVTFHRSGGTYPIIISDKKSRCLSLRIIAIYRVLRTFLNMLIHVLRQQNARKRCLALKKVTVFQ